MKPETPNDNADGNGFYLDGLTAEEWRDKWRQIEVEDARQWKPKPIIAKVRRFLSLRKTFSGRFFATREAHQLEKQEYLSDLQARLRKVAQHQHGRVADGS